MLLLPLKITHLENTNLLLIMWKIFSRFIHIFRLMAHLTNVKVSLCNNELSVSNMFHELKNGCNFPYFHYAVEDVAIFSLFNNLNFMLLILGKKYYKTVTTFKAYVVNAIQLDRELAYGFWTKYIYLHSNYCFCMSSLFITLIFLRKKLCQFL